MVQKHSDDKKKHPDKKKDFTKKYPTWIPVVVALIQKNNELLVGLRPAEKELAEVWEFPGGKVEPGEDPTNALSRELEEELGIHAEVGELKFVSSHCYGETNILLMFFEVLHWKGEPKPIYHRDLKWVCFNHLSNMNLPEANQAVLPKVRQALTCATV